MTVSPDNYGDVENSEEQAKESMKNTAETMTNVMEKQLKKGKTGGKKSAKKMMAEFVAKLLATAEGKMTAGIIILLVFALVASMGPLSLIGIFVGDFFDGDEGNDEWPTQETATMAAINSALTKTMSVSSSSKILQEAQTKIREELREGTADAGNITLEWHNLGEAGFDTANFNYSTGSLTVTQEYLDSWTAPTATGQNADGSVKVTVNFNLVTTAGYIAGYITAMNSVMKNYITSYDELSEANWMNWTGTSATPAENDDGSTRTTEDGLPVFYSTDIDNSTSGPISDASFNDVQYLTDYIEDHLEIETDSSLWLSYAGGYSSYYTTSGGFRLVQGSDGAWRITSMEAVYNGGNDAQTGTDYNYEQNVVLVDASHTLSADYVPSLSYITSSGGTATGKGSTAITSINGITVEGSESNRVMDKNVSESDIKGLSKVSDSTYLNWVADSGSSSASWDCQISDQVAFSRANTFPCYAEHYEGNQKIYVIFHANEDDINAGRTSGTSDENAVVEDGTYDGSLAILNDSGMRSNLLSMISAAKDAGIDISITRGYDASNGASEHQTGTAVDLSTSNGDKWLEDNAYTYGFIRSTDEAVCTEHNHWRYVGKSMAGAMHNSETANYSIKAFIGLSDTWDESQLTANYQEAGLKESTTSTSTSTTGETGIKTYNYIYNIDTYIDMTEFYEDVLERLAERQSEIGLTEYDMKQGNNEEIATEFADSDEAISDSLLATAKADNTTPLKKKIEDIEAVYEEETDDVVEEIPMCTNNESPADSTNADYCMYTTPDGMTHIQTNGSNSSTGDQVNSDLSEAKSKKNREIRQAIVNYNPYLIDGFEQVAERLSEEEWETLPDDEKGMTDCTQNGIHSESDMMTVEKARYKLDEEHYYQKWACLMRLKESIMQEYDGIKEYYGFVEEIDWGTESRLILVGSERYEALAEDILADLLAAGLTQEQLDAINPNGTSYIDQVTFTAWCLYQYFGSEAVQDFVNGVKLNADGVSYTISTNLFHKVSITGIDDFAVGQIIVLTP